MDVTLQRIAKWGDGWIMLSEPPGPKAVAEFDKLRRLVEAEGRDPASVGLEVWTSTGSGTEKDWREEISFWKKAGVTHVTLHNTFGGYHHKRMAGRSMTDHVDAMRRYRNAVADFCSERGGTDTRLRYRRARPACGRGRRNRHRRGRAADRHAWRRR